MSILSPSGWLKTRNGNVFYSYQGTKTAGATTETVIDISNVGLDDLFVSMYYTADWQAVVDNAGVSVSIDSFDILFQQSDTASGLKTVPPWHFEFIAPAQSALAVVSHCGAASTGAFRAVWLIAYPLEMKTWP